MNYKNLIERLKYYGTTYAIGDNLGKEIDGSDELMLNAATALSTLQAENEKLRAELAQMAACVYYKAGGLCQCGGDDPANVCVMGPCPHERTAEEVLADLARVTAERDAAVECLRNKCPFCRKYLTCQGRTINTDCWEFFGLKED